MRASVEVDPTASNSSPAFFSTSVTRNGSTRPSPRNRSMFGGRRRWRLASLPRRSITFGSSSAGRVSTLPASTSSFQKASPRSVRTMTIDQPSMPRPPREMSACSAPKSGQKGQPQSRARGRHSFRGISWSVPSSIVTMTFPLMLIFSTRDMSIPYSPWSFASRKGPGRKVSEHSSPTVSRTMFDHFRTPESAIFGAADVSQDTPTMATFFIRCSAAAFRARGVAQ